jgi:hypothetical protein
MILFLFTSYYFLGKTITLYGTKYPFPLNKLTRPC